MVRQRDQQIEEVQAKLQEAAQERERLRGDYARLRQEAQEKIDKLMERIKELNQRLMGGDAGGGQQKSGIFR
jgi:peptidoglycan hydrolase CwlO-like protein